MILLGTITLALTFRKYIPTRSLIETPAPVNTDWIHHRSMFSRKNPMIMKMKTATSETAKIAICAGLLRATSNIGNPSSAEIIVSIFNSGFKKAVTATCRHRLEAYATLATRKFVLHRQPFAASIATVDTLLNEVHPFDAIKHVRVDRVLQFEVLTRNS